MQETPSTQYLFAPASTMYHLAKDENFAVCGFYAGNYLGNSVPRRRSGDWRLTSEKPETRFDALCPKCRRTINGEPEPEIDWQALSSRRLMHIPP